MDVINLNLKLREVFLFTSSQLSASPVHQYENWSLLLFSSFNEVNYLHNNAIYMANDTIQMWVRVMLQVCTRSLPRSIMFWCCYYFRRFLQFSVKNCSSCTQFIGARRSRSMARWELKIHSRSRWKKPRTSLIEIKLYIQWERMKGERDRLRHQNRQQLEMNHFIAIWAWKCEWLMHEVARDAQNCTQIHCWSPPESPGLRNNSMLSFTSLSLAIKRHRSIFYIARNFLTCN